MTLTSDLQLGVNLYKLYSDKTSLNISECISFLIKDNYLVDERIVEVDALIDAKLLLVPSLRIKRILKGYRSSLDSLPELSGIATVNSEDIELNDNPAVILEESSINNHPSDTPNVKNTFQEAITSTPLSSDSAVSNSDLKQSISSGIFDSSTISDPSLVEHATIFSAPGSATTEFPTQSSFSNSQSKIEAPNKLKFPIRIILSLLSIIALSVSLFKVEALCEPLGLCDSNDKPKEGSKNDSNDDQGSRVIDLKEKESTGSIDLDSVPQGESALDSQPPIIPPIKNNSDIYSAPDREEALW